MIDLDNGYIRLEKTGIILSKKTSVDDFKHKFPESMIHNINDMHNGYIWYTFIEKIEDELSVFSLCFAPDGYLSMLSLLPNKSEFSDWSQWSEEEMIQDKKYNDMWLAKISNKSDPIQEYSWGKIGSYSDNRSGNSCIYISWNNI